MRYARLGLAGLFSLLAISTAGAAPMPDRSCFARALPDDIRSARLDDLKRLIGWVFDVAAAHRALIPGEIVDRGSGLNDVPGFAGATGLGELTGRYRVMRAPFDAGHGYFGVALGTLDENGRVTSIFLINRLFRLPIVAQQPAGVLTDIVTNGAMMTGLRTQAVIDAENAADRVFAEAAQLGVPLLTAGQSQAGGTAEIQSAYLVATHPGRSILRGFVTMNAAPVTRSVRRLGLAPDAVPGINFAKDLDPGVGPHGLLPNGIGLQIFIHPDGTGSGEPGDQSIFAALRHPAQHLLAEFDHVSLTKALAATLGEAPDRCVVSG